METYDVIVGTLDSKFFVEGLSTFFLDVRPPQHHPTDRCSRHGLQKWKSYYNILYYLSLSLHRIAHNRNPVILCHSEQASCSYHVRAPHWRRVASAKLVLTFQGYLCSFQHLGPELELHY